MDALPINWALAKNPLNWFIVVFMVVLAAVGIDLILTAVNGGLPGQGGLTPNGQNPSTLSTTGY